MATHPKVLRLTSEPTVTYSTHIHNISVHAHNLQITKVLTATPWGNRRRYSWLPTIQSWYWLWSTPLPYGRFLHPGLALTNCKSCRTQHWELPQDAQDTHTYICMTKHSHFPYTSTYSSMPLISNRKHKIHHIPYTNIQHISTCQGLKHTILNNVRNIINIPTYPRIVITTDIQQACTIYTHLLSICI